MIYEYKDNIIESMLELKEIDCVKVLKQGIALGMEIQKEVEDKD